MQLRCDTVDCKPQDIDWREALDENLEGYRVYKHVECSCGAEHVVCGIGEDEIQCGECGDYVYSSGPMMNYWYPVRLDDPESAAEKIKDWPLCVVEFDDGQAGIALTGGGMDLTWEICAAFVALGFLPPVHFCDLPDMAHWEKDSWRKEILEACVQSADVATRWAERKAEKCRRMLARM